jgi:hypothetical protein
MNQKTSLQLAAINYAEKQFESKYEHLTRDEVKAEFSHCVTTDTKESQSALAFG